MLNLLAGDNAEQTNVRQDKIVNLVENTLLDKTEKQATVLEEKNKDSDNSNSFKQIRIGNTLYNPQKNIISEIRNNWGKLKDLAFDKEFGNIARLLSSDIIPVAASETNVILISKLNGLAEQLNNDIYMVDKIFEKTFSKKYKAICISEKEWNDCIELYKKDKTYFKYYEEQQKTKNAELTLKEKAKALFEDI